MPTLQDTISDPAKRKAIIADCVTVIDQEVGDKGGISGLAVKAAYKLVKGFKPGFVPETVDSLLDDFCKKLQPIADEAGTQSVAVSKHFVDHRGQVADALLSITDERAKRSRHGAVKGAYERLRSSAKKHVEEAVPRVGTLVEKHTK
jgi:hypothetical protein